MPETLTMDRIVKAAEEVALKYGLRKVSLFGSYARGNASESSDVDFVVEMSRPLGFRAAGCTTTSSSVSGATSALCSGKRISIRS